MAVVRSPFSQNLQTPAALPPRQPSNLDIPDPREQLARIGGGGTGVQRSPLSTARGAGTGGAVRAREVTPGMLREQQNQILDSLRQSGELRPQDVGAVRSELSTARQGGEAFDPFADQRMQWERALGSGLNFALRGLAVPQKAVQSFLGASGEAIGAAARSATQQGFDTGATRVGRVQPAQADRVGFTGRFKDPEYRLKVPNLRDTYTGAFTGVGWVDAALNSPVNLLDGIAEFGLMAGTDPLTAFTFGAGNFTGAAGRAALGSKLLRKEVVDQVPSLANKADDIVRYGEWALDDAERAVLVPLGIIKPKGIGFIIGDKTIPRTGALAEGVGRPLSRARAAIGDTIGETRLGSKAIGLTTVGSRRMLEDVARGNVGKKEAFDTVVRYAGTRAAKAAGNTFNQRMAARYYPLLRQLVDSPYANDVAASIEPGVTGVRVALPDPQAQQLADNLSAAFNDIKDEYNRTLEKFATDYGLEPSFISGISDIDDYFYHAITDDAVRWMRSQSNRQSGFLPEIEANLALAPSELGRGSGPLRSRKLTAGSEWLGETLQSGSIAEINEISMRKLGVEWFKTDAADVLGSYINSVSDQIKRLAFMDTMYNYGPDYIRPILGRVIPDPAMLKPVQQSVDDLFKVRARLLRAIDPAVEGIKKQLGRSVRVATNIIEKGERSLDLREAAAAKLRPQLEQQIEQVARLRNSVEAQEASTRAAYEDILVPLEARLRSIVSAIDAGRGSREVARQRLFEEHSKLFPRMSARNREKLSLTQLAAQVADKTGKVYEQKIRSLETRVRRRRATAGTQGRAAERAETRAEVLSQVPEGEREAYDFVRRLNATEVDVSTTPEAAVFTTRGALDQAQEGDVSVLSVSAREIQEEAEFVGDVAVSFPAPHKDVVFRPQDNLDHFNQMMEYLPASLGDDVVEILTRSGGNAVRGENISFSLKSGGQRTNLLSDVERDFVETALSYKEAKFIEPELFEEFYDQLEAKLARVLDEIQGTPYSQELAEDILRSSIVGTFDNRIGGPIVEALGRSDYGKDAFANIGFPVVTLPSKTVLGEYDLFAGNASVARYLQTDPERALDSMLPDGSSNPAWDTTFDEIPFDVEQQISAGISARTQGVREATETAATAAEASRVARTEAAAAGRQLGGTRTAAARAEQRVSSLSETALDRDPLLEIAGEPAIPLTVATKESKEQQRKINKARNQLVQEMNADPALKALGPEEVKLRKLGTRVDAAEALAADSQAWLNDVAPIYEADINNVVGAINSAPPSGSAGSVAGEWGRRAQQLTENLQALDLSDAERAAYDKVYTQLFALEGDLAQVETGIMMGEGMLAAIRSGEFGTELQKQILTGWREISNLGVQVPAPFVADLAASVTRLNNPAEWKNWTRHYFAYQRFFKSWAIATPGFTLRNAMTAAFNNFVAGVKPSDTGAGIKFALDNGRRTRGGLDYALSRVPEGERELYEQAYQAVSLSGGGQAVDEVMPLLRGQGSRVYNNVVTRTSQRLNEGAEIGMRMGMALDGIRKGLGVDGAAARIARYQFDYSDLSQLDMYAKSFIPFWVFAVRNVPLQMTMQFARPSMYRSYENLKSLEQDADDSQWPLWLRDRDPIRLGGARYLNIDLPQIEMEQQISNLLNGRMILSMANPLFRVPIEGVMGRSAAFDAPFSSQPRQVGVTDAPSALASQLLGLVGAGRGPQRGPDGGLFISDWEQQIGPNLLPPLQQLQRVGKPLLPESVQSTVGGTPRYAERDPLTVLGAYLGIPVGQVTQEQVEGEMRRRQYEMRDVRGNVVERSRRTRG